MRTILLLVTLTTLGCASVANRPENWKARFPHEKFVQLGPITTRYKVIGQGPPLLLIHGIAFGYDMFNANIEELSKHFTVYMFDQRGMGFSSKPPGYNYSTYTQFQHLMEFLQVTGQEKISVWGHSMGAYLALLLAYYQPERIDKLIVSDVPLGQTNLPSPLLRFYTTPIIGRWFAWFPMKSAIRAILWDVYEDDIGYVTPDRVNQAYDIMALPGAGVALRKVLRSIDYNEAAMIEKDYFPRIMVPTLILWGEKDKWFSPYLGETLHQKIKGSELVIIPGGGHMVIEECADVVNPIVLRFLQTGRLEGIQ